MAANNVSRRSSTPGTLNAPANTASSSTLAVSNAGLSYQPGRPNLANTPAHEGAVYFHLPDSASGLAGTQGQASASGRHQLSASHTPQMPPEVRKARAAELRIQLNKATTAQERVPIYQQIADLAKQSGKQVPQQMSRQPVSEEPSAEKLSKAESSEDLLKALPEDDSPLSAPTPIDEIDQTNAVAVANSENGNVAIVNSAPDFVIQTLRTNAVAISENGNVAIVNSVPDFVIQTPRTNIENRPDGEQKREYPDGLAVQQVQHAGNLSLAGDGDLIAPYQDDERPNFEGLVDYLDSLGTTGLTREQLREMALPTFNPATVGDQAWGIIKAGAVAYGTSFMVGKLIVNYLSLAGVNGGTAAWAMFPLAGVLNELVSTPLAGAIRGNHGTYGSADGAASANFHTANARLLAARISGNKAEIAQCRKDLNSIVTAAVDSAKRRAGPDVNAKLWAQWDGHPMVSAAIRSWVTDDLPFVSFIAMYLAPGGTAPLLKEALDNPVAFAALDGLIFAACGATAASLTVLGQNLGRICLQHAPRPTQGTETQSVRERHVYQAVEMRRALDENVETLQEYHKDLEDKIKAGDSSAETKQLCERIVHMINVLTAREMSQEDRIRALQSGFGRTGLAAGVTFRGNVLGEPINPPATSFLDGAPTVRRTIATALGNATALVPFTAFMLGHVIPLAAQAAGLIDPDAPPTVGGTGFNATGFDDYTYDHFNSTMANSTLTSSFDNGVNYNGSMYGMVGPVVLVAPWLFRRTFATGYEYTLAALTGLGRLAGRAASSNRQEPVPQDPASVELLRPAESRV
jgi:hypothetical protein